MIPRVNQKLLTQNMLYFEFDKEDAWGKRVFKAATKVSNVRISDDVIFVYSECSTPFIPLKKYSQVIINSTVYDVSNVISVMTPFSNKVWSYELELTNPRQIKSGGF